MPPDPRTVRVVVAASAPAGTVDGVLDAGERARLAILRDPAARDAWASAHALLRLVVGDVLGRDPAPLSFTATCRTCGGPHGRPELADEPALHLGLSHTAGLVAVAVGTAGPLGVDVERVAATEFEGFDSVALAPGERARTATDRARTWVRKEALLKATGHGLAVEPSTVRLTAPDAPPRVLEWAGPQDPGPVQLHDLDAPCGFAAAVAVLGAQRWELEVGQHTW